jgi:hypothetical protein
LAAVLVTLNVIPVSLAFLKFALSAVDRIDSALSAHVLQFMDFDIGESFDCLCVITCDCREAVVSDENHRSCIRQSCFTSDSRPSFSENNR